MNKNSLGGLILKNLRIFQEFKQCKFDYILNPETDELHRVKGGTLSGKHNLHLADIENFIGLSNVDSIPVHSYQDGTLIPVYDLVTCNLIGEYKLNKCLHCFPNLS